MCDQWNGHVDGPDPRPHPPPEPRPNQPYCLDCLQSLPCSRCGGFTVDTRWFRGREYCWECRLEIAREPKEKLTSGRDQTLWRLGDLIDQACAAGDTRAVELLSIVLRILGAEASAPAVRHELRNTPAD